LEFKGTFHPLFYDDDDDDDDDDILDENINITKKT
jgi:hypothetical protein